MSRAQLALNVANLEESIAFYSRLFATGPAKVRPGYANFAITNPPLKLVLIEDATKAPTSLNHLGVEVGSVADVSSAKARLASAGVATEVEDRVTCCYAVQDKVLGPGAGRGELGVLHGPGRRRDARRPAACRRRERADVLRRHY